MTGLIDVFTRHRIAANLAMIMMTLAGMWAIRNITTQLDPAVEYPQVWISVDWPGASAEDVEQLVTVPIEQELRGLTQLSEIRSTSKNGNAFLFLEFRHDSDMQLALDQAKQRVANVRNLPPDIEPPRISRNIDMEGIANVLVTSNGTLLELVPLVREFETQLRARGIEDIRFNGLPAEELAIMVPSQRLAELHMSLDELAVEIGRQSRNVPAGSIGRGHGSRQLRSVDQQRDSLGFEHLNLADEGRLIQLGSIAEIVRRPKDHQIEVKRDGRPAIEMRLLRRTETDALTTAQALHDWADETRPTLPQGVEIYIFSEAWVLLSDQLTLILKNGLSGLVLVVITLFVFLGGRVGWWVTIGIPISFLLALAFYYGVFGGGINILALITFIMAVGIVVDDAIVVGEDAATQYEQGKSPIDAAVGGARRMLTPVMTSSLTTLAAFVPLLLIGGPMGDLILTMPMVLLCVILASLIECFLVLPGHLKGSFTKMQLSQPSRFRQRFDAAFRRLREERFRPLLRRALDYPGATFCTALIAVLLASALVISGRVNVNFITGFSLESLEAQVAFSSSASEGDQAAFIGHLERTLATTTAEMGDENVTSYLTRFNLAEFNRERKEGAQYASLIVEYGFEEVRSIEPTAFVNRWRELVTRPPYVEQLHMGVAGGANHGQPDITLVLRGKDVPTLKQAADELADALAGYEGVSNVIDDLPYGREQLIFGLTPEGRALGLTTTSIGRQLRAAYNGERIQIFNQNETELEVRVMLPDAERDNLASLKQFPVLSPAGTMVPLGTVATLSQRRGIDLIQHNNTELAVRVSANVNPDENSPLTITSHLQENALADILDKYGVSFGLSGKSQSDAMILRTMGLGAILTLIFIYLILAWVFASYSWPLAIMIAIPFGLTGAIAGHWIMGMEIGAMSMLAFFALTGIVVNDSIVLITFFKRDVDKGVPYREAIENAAVSRFRAVLLTSLTTIAGLTPLMFETSSLAMYIVPIAATICFGLAFATLLVLFVVPALIVLAESAKYRLIALRASLLHKLTVLEVKEESLS
ncbi:MAG: efflux RND transporter permease subunit [Gammaproteobacteria bacterium]|nr:efflux RND transporter permease subunit [Gammaproteobacteria bacterium]